MSRDGSVTSYKRGVTGSNPVAPTKFSQLNGLFETLIGGSVTTAGNHRCMLPDGRRVPEGRGSIPFDHRARRAPTAGTTALELHGGLKDPRRPASVMHAYIVVRIERIWSRGRAAPGTCTCAHAGPDQRAMHRAGLGQPVIRQRHGTRLRGFPP
jgi:hypothetical protein